MRYLENKKSKRGLFCGTHACNWKHIINFSWPYCELFVKTEASHEYKWNQTASLESLYKLKDI